MTLKRRDFTLASLAAVGSLATTRAGASDEEGKRPNPSVNRRIVLASRPRGKATIENFRLEEGAVPQPAQGQVLMRTRYLSLDPYMRGRMNDAESYADPVALGDVMVGGTVGEVVASKHDNYKLGDLVSGWAGWQDYALSDGSDLLKLDPRIMKPSYALGILGMPGLTAYIGLLDIGQPKAGETVVLAASTGAVGSVVGQIAKIKGCRVVGIAGAQKKCEYAVKTLGYDACVSHYDKDMAEQLRAACPDGIDVYFENVGGSSWAAVMPLLNDFARVPVCGLIAHYNQSEPLPGPDRMPQLQGLILRRSIKMQGFLVGNYRDRIPAFIGDMMTWLSEDKLTYREHVVEGLENAPEAFLGFFSGANFGKLVVKVS